MKELPQLTPETPSPAVSRRQFLRMTTVATAAAVGAPAILNAQAKQPIHAVIIGIGGRGGGAGKDFMEALKITGAEGKVVAVADIFPEQAIRGRENFGVPEDKCFSGFDAYQKALAVAGVNYAILATPPGFRAAHFKAAIAAGKHVFMEKPVAVDGTGCRIVYAAGEEAKRKNLKVAAGTQRRHRPSYIETVKRIHGGEIGDVTALRAYWVNSGPIWHRTEQEAKATTELERQIRNWYHYIWLCGDHICEQHVHNIDVCNWVIGDHPVKAWGMGARQQLQGKSGEIWDNFAIEFEYANGVRMHSYCGQIKREWSSVSEAVVGSKGTSELRDGRNLIRPKGGTLWRTGEMKDDNGYVNEHCNLINAILMDTDLNEAKNVTDSTLTAIMGREAAYGGAVVEWNDMLQAKFAYGPDLMYENPAAMQWGPFRTLKPPMPSQHDIFKAGAQLPVA